MRKILVIFIAILTMIGVGVKAASYPPTYLPIVYGPPAKPEPTTVPPTPHPEVVEVLPNYSWYVYDGKLNIMGEVQNYTRDYVDLIEITVDVYNDLDQLINPYTTYTYLDNALAAGDKTYFLLSIIEPPGWAYFEFEAPAYEIGGEPAPNLVIEDEGSIWVPNEGFYYLWASVRNADIVAVNYTHVIIAIYDSGGKVIAGGYVPLAKEYLYPGQISDFMTQFADQDYSSVTYRLQADGWKQP